MSEEEKPHQFSVERLSVGVTAIAAVAFTVGAYFFAGLASEVRGLRADMNTIATRVSVFESQALEARIRTLEEKCTINTQRIGVLMEKGDKK